MSGEDPLMQRALGTVTHEKLLEPFRLFCLFKKNKKNKQENIPRVEQVWSV